MYIISNQDMEQAIEFAEQMIVSLTDTGLRAQNKKRLAQILVRKLKRKQPFTMSELPDDIRQFFRKK